MKNYFFTTLILVLTIQLYAQTIANSKVVELPKHNGTVLVSDNYYVQRHTIANSDGVPMKYRFDVFDFETSTLRSSENFKLEHENFNGVIIDQFLKGDYSYELVRYTKGFLVANSRMDCRVAVVKRDLRTFQLESAMAWVGNYKLDYQVYGPNVRFHSDETGFYVVSSEWVEDKPYFFQRYDFDLQKLWNVDVPGNPSDVKVRDFTVDVDHGALARISIESEEKNIAVKGGEEITHTTDLFMVINHEGEVIKIVPQFKEELIVVGSKHVYDFDKKVLTGILMITDANTESRKVKLEGQRIAYYQWDDEGNIIQSTDKKLTYGDLINDEVRNFMKLKTVDLKVNDSDPFPVLGTEIANSMQLFPLKNGNLIMLTAYTSIVNGDFELGYSAFISEFDKNGELIWSHLIPRLTKDYYDKYVRYFRLFSLGEDKLYMFYDDFKESFVDGKFVVKTKLSTPDKENKAFGLMTIDANTGEALSNELVPLKVDAEMVNNSVFKIPNGYLIKYSDKKDQKAMFFRVLFD